MLALMLALGCADGTKIPPVVWGEPDDTGAAESDTPGDDTAPTDDTDPPADDTDPPADDTDPPATDEVCYLGQARDNSTCLPVVAWSASWGSDYAYPTPYNGSAQYREPLAYLDLATADPDLRLAPNFVLGEFLQEWKGRYGVFQPHVVTTLQQMRDNVGSAVIVNSGYRNVSYNASVGGATYSRHMYGDAVDLDIPALSLEELGDLCDIYGADYIGYYDAHVHCDWRDAPMEAAFYGSARAAARGPRPQLDASLTRQGLTWTAPATGWDEGEPLRRWTALDADGRVLAEGSGPRFTPPEGAAAVRVVVGRAITLRAELP